MSEVAAAANDLAEALREVENLRVVTDPAETVEPPGAVIGPPALTWESGCSGPTHARFLVYVVVGAQDSRALEKLWDLVPLVAEAIDGMRSAVVLRADPGSWLSGSTELPAYTVEVEIAL